MSGIPFPEESYVVLIGQVAYAVSYIEWLLLGDLNRLPDLPPELSVGNLAGKTTEGIASEVDAQVTKVSNPDVQRFLTVCAEALHALAPMRNHILHARPATVDGAQRLNRWRRLPSGTVEAFTIYNHNLQSVLERADQAIADINAVRLPL